MIKIMIVDDIPIFLEYLRGFINWEEYGFEICAQASNGKEAFEKIEECYLDVILTDITMPYMDGLELAEKVMNQYPDISVILITGNNEFEYARKALKIGVCDYIVKPFEKEELLLSLLKLQDNINKVLENKDVQQNDFHMEKEKIFRKNILGNRDEEFLWKKEMKNAGIEFSSDYYLLGCIHLQMDGEKDFEDFLNWENILISMLKDSLRVKGEYEVFRDFQNHILFIINFRSEADMTSYRAYELADFPKIIARRLGMECCMCIGDYCYSLSDIKKEYYRILEILKDNGGEKLLKLFERKQKTYETSEQFYIPQYLTELNEALVNKDKEQFVQFWEREWESALSFESEKAEIQLFSNLLGLLLTDIINSGSSIENVYGEEFRPHTELYMIPEMEKRAKKLLSYYEWWLETASEAKISHSRVVAEKARLYIQEHYMEGDLSISDISRELYINQTYLRKMFKEEMGMTLWEFLTKYRMHMAKQLILNTEHNLTRIAEMVGYNDVSYFGKCFKKYYHVSPKQMTKQIYQTFE